MSGSRIEAARRRARAAKRAIALTAAGAFAVVLALARQGHPAVGVPKVSGGANGLGPAASSSQSHDGDHDEEQHDNEGEGSLVERVVSGLLAPSSSESPPAASHTS